MTDLLNKYKKQRKLELYNEQFDEIIKYKKSCFHNLMPSEFKDVLRFILKEQGKLGITKFEVYWWKHKPFLGKALKLVNFVLIEWKDGKTTKLSCMNRKGITELRFTNEIKNDILKYNGSIHYSEDG